MLVASAQRKGRGGWGNGLLIWYIVRDGVNYCSHGVMILKLFHIVAWGKSWRYCHLTLVIDDIIHVGKHLSLVLGSFRLFLLFYTTINTSS